MHKNITMTEYNPSTIKKTKTRNVNTHLVKHKALTHQKIQFINNLTNIKY